jgi:hypothetical protein
VHLFLQKMQKYHLLHSWSCLLSQGVKVVQKVYWRGAMLAPP